MVDDATVKREAAWATGIAESPGRLVHREGTNGVIVGMGSYIVAARRADNRMSSGAIRDPADTLREGKDEMGGVKPAIKYILAPSERPKSWASSLRALIRAIRWGDPAGIQTPLEPYTLPEVLTLHGDRGEPPDLQSSIPSHP